MFRMHLHSLVLLLAAVSAGAQSADQAPIPDMVVIHTPRGGTFSIGKYEVTYAEYLPSVVEADCPVPQNFRGHPKMTKEQAVSPKYQDRFAVSGVGTDGAFCYLAWLKRKTGQNFRLPTRDEWVIASGTKPGERYPWGNDLGMGNALMAGGYDTKRIFTHMDPEDPRFLGGRFEVGLLPPNKFGLYDIIGNAAELTATYRPSTIVCPQVGCREFATLGGALDGLAKDPVNTPQLSIEHIGVASVGFRVALSPPI